MEQGKNSIKRYILIAAVTIIWAIVVYKIIDFIKADSSPAIGKLHVEKKAEEKSKEKKEYTLLLSYQDPFLKEDNSFATAVDEPPSPIPVKVIWPQLKYNGYLKSSKGFVGVLELNGRYQSVKKGDIIEEVKVVEIYEDSIRLKCKDELKTLLR